MILPKRIFLKCQAEVRQGARDYARHNFSYNKFMIINLLKTTARRGKCAVYKITVNANFKKFLKKTFKFVFTKRNPRADLQVTPLRS